MYSYIVRPEKVFLTQSCNNTYLRIFKRYSCITPLTSNILLSSLLRMDWIVSVWTDLTSPQWEHLKSVIKLTLKFLLDRLNRVSLLWFSLKKKPHWNHTTGHSWSPSPSASPWSSWPKNGPWALHASLLPYRAAIPDLYSSSVILSLFMLTPSAITSHRLFLNHLSLFPDCCTVHSTVSHTASTICAAYRCVIVTNFLN